MYGRKEGVIHERVKKRKLNFSPIHLRSAELMLIRIPLLNPFETSFGRTSVKEAVIVRLDSGDSQAYGECTAEREPYYSYEFNSMSWKVISDLILPMLAGAEICSPLDFGTLTHRVRGHSMSKGAVEMALWDLFCRSAGMPLHRAIGGVRKRIECGISIGIQDSVDTLISTIARSLDQGYRRIKIKVKPGWDTEVLERVRTEFPDIPLQVDANAAYSLHSIRTLKDMDRFNLTMIEQPLDYDDLLEHSILQRRIRTPICLDESIKGDESVKLMHRLGSGRVVNIKAGRVGGIAGSLSVHDTAMERNIPVWIGGMLETGIGRSFNVALNTLPDVRFPGDTSPSSRYFRRDIIVEPFEMDSKGRMPVPSKNGSGIEVDERELERWTAKRKILKLS